MTLPVERFHSREGHHLFLCPFAGRLVRLELTDRPARILRGA